MKDNSKIVLVGACMITLLAVVDPSLRQIAIGALIGLLSGHLNGIQKDKNQT